MNVVPPDAGTVDTSTGQPGFSVPSSSDSAWTSCREIVAAPIAPATNSVRDGASPAGGLSTRVGRTVWHLATLSGGAVLRRAADVAHPDDRPGRLVEREDVVPGRDRDEDALAARAVLEIERGRVRRAREGGVEPGSHGHRRRSCLG